jgi:hypothetical protein
MAAQVQIINFGCFYGPGAKTVHSDKVWGNAEINGSLVSFWGKRGGRLSFKTRAGAQGRRDAEMKWAEKIGGRTSGDVYTVVSDAKIQRLLCPTLAEDVVSHYYSKMSKGQLKTG